MILPDSLLKNTASLKSYQLTSQRITNSVANAKIEREKRPPTRKATEDGLERLMKTTNAYNRQKYVDKTANTNKPRRLGKHIEESRLYKTTKATIAGQTTPFKERKEELDRQREEAEAPYVPPNVKLLPENSGLLKGIKPYVAPPKKKDDELPKVVRVRELSSSSRLLQSTKASARMQTTAEQKEQESRAESESIEAAYSIRSVSCLSTSSRLLQGTASSKARDAARARRSHSF